MEKSLFKKIVSRVIYNVMLVILFFAIFVLIPLVIIFYPKIFLLCVYFLYVLQFFDKGKGKQNESDKYVGGKTELFKNEM